MPVIKFEVNNVEYCAHLSKSHITINGKDRRTCECTVSLMNPIRIFSGTAIKHPNDCMKFDKLYGYHLAFKRALFSMYIVQQFHKDGAPRHSILLGWNDFWQSFRIPFGKALHEWDISDDNFQF